MMAIHKGGRGGGECPLGCDTNLPVPGLCLTYNVAHGLSTCMLCHSAPGCDLINRSILTGCYYHGCEICMQSC